MSDKVDISQAIGLPPTDTVEFFQAKGQTVITPRWWMRASEEYVRARTIAGVNDVATINAVYEQLDDMIANGGTFEMWKAKVLPGLRDAVAGGKAPENILTDHRLRTIYGVNLRTARAAGQWKRIQQLKDVAPYLMYSAIMDDRTRPLHRKWHHTVLPVDHPWWDTHFPPCGWNCRCTVVQLTEDELQRRGLTVSETPPDDGPDREWVTPEGVVQDVPPGIDPGWAYNVGKEHLRGLSDAFVQQLDRLVTRNVAAARNALESFMTETQFDVLLKADGNAVPIMIFDMDQRALMNAETSVARMTSTTYAEQLRNHPELLLDDYRRLLNIGADPDLILESEDVRIVLYRAPGEWWSMVTLQLSVDGQQMEVVRYNTATDDMVNDLRATFRTLFDAGR